MTLFLTACAIVGLLFGIAIGLLERKKMIKKYFVSYNFMNKDGVCGYGNCILKCNKEITVNTLTEWREVIEKNNEFKKVVILNFIEVQDD